MKMMKKLATLMLTVCLIVPCFSILTHAANGAIQFTDPSTKVGETVEVVGKIKRTDGTGYGQVEVTMMYDTSMLKFKSGAGITESTAGTIVYVGDATNDTGREHAFTMQFDVLKAGTTKLTITEATVKSLAGATLDYTKGSSTITIAEGEGAPVTDPVTEPADDATVSGEGTVEVNGVTYTISNEFPENEIPSGYEESTLNYDMKDYKVVYNENTGLRLAYLIGSDNVGKFYMYVEDDATFAPFAQISISDSADIVLLSDVSDVVLPEEYAEVELSIGGQIFPAWNDTTNIDLYIIYALNGNGENTLYQYDSVERTYQRFTAPEMVVEEQDNSFIGKLTGLLENHLDYVILGTGLGFILFILIIIVLGVKLYNRNAELDEIYDEYGIDLDEDKTEDDVILDLDDEDEDYEDADDEDDDMSFLVREGMREVFPEEVEDEVNDEENEAESVEDIQESTIEVVPVKEKPEIQESLGKVVEQTSAPAVEVANTNEEENSLAMALAKQKKADGEKKEEYYDDEEDDFLENFSMDFIDLDD